MIFIEFYYCHVVRRLDDACDHILSFLDGRDSLVAGTTCTYRQLHDTLDVIVSSGYFTRPVCDDSRDDSDTARTNEDDLQSMSSYVHVSVCVCVSCALTEAIQPLNTQQ